jgi:hypothetical protein
MMEMNGLEIVLGDYYTANPTELGYGVYKILNMNHYARVVMLRHVRTGKTCWTKVENVEKRATKSEVVLECLK